MDGAKSKDQSRSAFFSGFKAASQSKKDEDNFQDKTTFRVDFILQESLPHTNTNTEVVPQELSKSSSLEEVIWNFSRLKDKRFRLKQNPHFYKYNKHLSSYGSEFRADPIFDFQDVKKVFVLHDKPGHVYLVTTANKKRAFGNFWRPNDAIIFKDFDGKLEGEGVVGKCIESTADIWYSVELSPLHTLYGDSPRSVTVPHPIDTASPTNPSVTRLRELVLQKQDGYHLRISTKQMDGWPSSPGLPSPMQRITLIGSASRSIASPSPTASTSVSASPAAAARPRLVSVTGLPVTPPPPTSSAPSGLPRTGGTLTAPPQPARPRSSSTPISGLPTSSNETTPPITRSSQSPSGPSSVTQSTPPQDVVVRMAPSENTVRLLAVASRDPKRDFQQDTSFGTVSILSQASVAGGPSPPVNKIPREFSISIGRTTSQSGRDPLGPVDPAPNNPPSQHDPHQKAPKLSLFQKIQKAVKHFIKN
ncbi:hypothetical protein BGW80DRAFT_1455295 [Lactifluus volemus]|nr:hypothetical protein BGW80DRAFT_1455295 [Lactifluus volemus]